MLRVIAELCQNHKGDESSLMEMVAQVAKAGASHAKIQHIYADNLVYRPEFEVGDEESEFSQGTFVRPFRAEFERLLSLELSDGACRAFVRRCNELDIVPVTTCFARGDLPRIIDQGFREIKIASYDCGSPQLLRDVSGKFEHVYISTGASYDDEIRLAASIMKKADQRFTLLHCVTCYPTPISMLNLARIKWLKQFQCEVGYSDHSLVSESGLLAAKVAIFNEINIIERHVTIFDAKETKDGLVSITPKQIEELLEFASLSKTQQSEALGLNAVDLSEIMGSCDRFLSAEELKNRSYYRGRFGTPRRRGSHDRVEMIQNWEEVAAFELENER